ncbi:hypothetical protein I302_105218 [Kwoniella bestiolae CBS 10118]|uniref:NAD(P)-binding protein n=1 Tax=Kwoniella bestiolae CBS 10118 TaxID=1296100 RepID=A0A1B9FSI1_9TREE|nr:hypothetical protein I302_08505 [Kwoniella bestiolae CBS 10118]OCF21728.1 hypothetical protein I302_08505 [Kwoniella bestiolae CBS 10118]
MSTQQKTVLITGANRGVGLALAESFIQKGYKVIAAVRDLSKAPSIAGLAAVVKIDSNELDDPAKAIEDLKKKGIDHVDIVIANAGISAKHHFMRDADMQAYDEHHQVIEEGGKFVVITSLLGSNTGEHFLKFGMYGSSKASVNYITRQIHFEEPGLTAFTIHPGWLDTQLGFEGATIKGIDSPPDKLSIAIPQRVDMIEKADRESRGGYMWNYDGEKLEF